MAPLAPGRQIARVVVSGIGILVAAGQHDAAELRPLISTMSGHADWWPRRSRHVPPGRHRASGHREVFAPGEMPAAAAFTKTAGALEPDGVGKLRPVNGIEEAILPVDGHYYSSQDLRPRSRATCSTGGRISQLIRLTRCFPRFDGVGRVSPFTQKTTAPKSTRRRLPGKRATLMKLMMRNRPRHLSPLPAFL